jgi:tetratricopeptide (TPR) repeat protein
MLRISVLLLVILCSCGTQYKAETDRYEQLILSETNNVIQFDTSRFEDNAKSFLIYGSLLQQQGNYAGSILELQEALSYDSSAAIEYAIAQSYLELNKFQNAKRHLIRSTKINPNFHQSLDLLTEIYLYENNSEKAEITNNLALKHKETTQRLITKAILLEDTNPNKSLNIYNSIDSPKYSVLIEGRKIELYKKTNQYDKLLVELKDKLKKEPFNNSVSREIFGIYLENNQFGNAIEYTSTVDTLFYGTEQETYYTLLGSILINQQNLDSNLAEKYISKIDGSLMFNSEILYFSGIISSIIGNKSKRDYFFNRLLKIDEHNSDLQMGMAEVYYFDREFQRSIEIIDKVNFDSIGNNLYYYLLKGMNFSNLKEYTEARNSYSVILDTDSSYNDYIALTLIGESFDLENKSDSALYYYQIHYNYDSNNIYLLNNYAYSLSKVSRDLSRALEMSEKTLEVDPNNSAYLDTYGWIQYQLGNVEIAKEYITKAIEIGGVSAEVYEHLGDIYLELGNEDEAKVYYNKALELDKDSINLEEKLNKEN